MKRTTMEQFSRQSRSSQGLSLKRKGSFAQAIGPRLSEAVNREPCKTREFSLRRALLAWAWARPPLAQTWGSSFGLQLQQHASSSHASSFRRAPLT